VSDATLTCNPGEVYGLLGPNGAGKTTTLRCLATVLTPTAGTATVAGHDLVKDPQSVRRSIGFLSASTGLYARLTPRETLRFFGSLHGMQGAALEERVERVLAMFDITSYADRANDRLSTGMKQRVGLARAVVHDPPVLILDEPTTGLDPIVTRTVEEAVLSLARDAGKCVLLSTHYLPQAEEICSRIGVIGDGRVLGEGTVEELCRQTGAESLRGAFFALVGSAEGSSGRTSSPSPGTPGEGRGEGVRSEIPDLRSPIPDPHPNPLPEYRARENEASAAPPPEGGGHAA
jgi:sodium transport system ATP-binding protein